MNRLLSKGNYLRLTYDLQRLPRTAYPKQLAAYLAGRFFARPGRLLDVGCGRGDFLSAFQDFGFVVAGADISPAAPELMPQHEVKVVDLENEALPYPPSSFDYVFSKSVLEHTRQPVEVLRRAYEALRPGGIAVIMVPSWETGYRGSFYVDHTHITPFTLPSLEDAVRLAGFEVVHGELFYQLPFLWTRPWMKPLVMLIAALPLRYRPMHKATWPEYINKLIWFSKEAMVLVVCRRPTEPEAPR
jgi:SAM-dependent methyltransferase